MKPIRTPRVRIHTEHVPDHLGACIGRTLYASVRGFFEDPKVQAEYALWLASRNADTANANCQTKGE